MSEITELLAGHDPKERIQQLEEENEKLKMQLGLQHALGQAASVVKIKSPRRKKGTYRAISAQMLSDWHCGEYVSLELTNGLNEYSPDICKRRVERVFDYALWRVNIERAAATIDTNVLWILGDLVSGMIHEDLRRTNTLNVVDELLFLKPLLISGIDYLLEKGEFRKIYIPCIWGNHARMNPKKCLIHAGRGDSLEALVFGDLQRHYADEERIEVTIAEGTLLYLIIEAFVQRGFHGHHQVKYNRGIGGVSVPLNKALPRMDEGIRADFNVFAHYHHREYIGRALANSALIGYGALAAAWAFPPEPAQQWFYTFDPVSKQILSIAPLFGEDPDEWLKRQREILR